jgi:hypothetical protein
MSSKHHLPFITFSNVPQVVCSTYVNFGVHFGMIELVQQSWDQGQKVSIIDGESI